MTRPLWYQRTPCFDCGYRTYFLRDGLCGDCEKDPPWVPAPDALERLLAMQGKKLGVPEDAWAVKAADQNGSARPGEKPGV